ncbi:MAG: histidine kinase dimerization/phospho-acceptor domain-containing protein, partial [Gemmatimonadales bacterium]
MSSNLRLRIAVAASTGLTILVLVFAATITSAVQVRRSVGQLADVHQASEGLRSISNSVLAMTSNERGYLLTGDTAYVASYDAAQQSLQRRINMLRPLQSVLPADSARFEALDSLLSTEVSELNAALAAYSGHESNGAVRQLARNQATGALDSLNATLGGLNLAAERQRQHISSQNARATRTLILSEVIGGVVAILLLLTAVRRISGDLDARELVEASLRRSERFLDSIVDMLPMMVSVKDAVALRFIRVNRTAEQLLGLPREAVVGRDDHELFPAPLADGFATMDRAVLASDVVRDIPEEVLVAPNGAVRTLHTRKVAIHDDGGHPAYLLAVSEDITDRKRAESDILRARENAEAANRAKSDFLAKMSHELRTPLNSIIGFSQLLEEENFGPLNERQRRYITNVLTSGRQLLDLINDVLDLSDLESHSVELEYEGIDLYLLLAGISEHARSWAIKAGLTFRLDCKQSQGPFLGDPRRLKQVLFNLIANAFKYTPRGGTVTLGGRITADEVNFFVADTGPGVPPDIMASVFDRFSASGGAV